MSDLGNKEVFSSNLKRIMEEKGETAKDICLKLGFTPSAFSQWTNGVTYPRIDKIEMLAKHFHINKSDLIEKPSNIPFDSLSESEQIFIERYRKSDIETKEMIKRLLAYNNLLNGNQPDQEKLP
jgi:transcriptional regulator with XRE-family HTH domain